MPILQGNENEKEMVEVYNRPRIPNIGDELC